MSSNRILSRLSRADFRLLEPHLEAVDLPVRRQLVGAQQACRARLFPGERHRVGRRQRGESIEIGIIGREGMTGMSVVLGSDENRRTKPTSGSQATASASCASNLREAIDASATLHKDVVACTSTDFLIQIAQTALANGRHKIEERLARGC